METRLSRWRYVAGAAYGLLLAAILTVAVTWLLDPLAQRCGHYHQVDGQEERWVYDTWLGLTPPEWHTVLVLGFLLLVPAGAILQRQRPFPCSLSPLATATIALVSALASAGALHLYCLFKFRWMMAHFF